MNRVPVAEESAHATGTGRAAAGFFGSRPPAPSIMTRDTLPENAITTSEEFKAVLATATEQAIDAGVDVRGTWEFETEGSYHRWDVEFVELATAADDD